MNDDQNTSNTLENLLLNIFKKSKIIELNFFLAYYNVKLKVNIFDMVCGFCI